MRAFATTAQVLRLALRFRKSVAKELNLFTKDVSSFPKRELSNYIKRNFLSAKNFILVILAILSEELF